MPPSGPDLLAEQDRRTLGVDQDIGQTLDIARVAERLGGGTIVAGFRQHGAGDVDLPVQHVARDFQVGRAVGAGEALAGGH